MGLALRVRKTSTDEVAHPPIDFVQTGPRSRLALSDSLGLGGGILDRFFGLFFFRVLLRLSLLFALRARCQPIRHPIGRGFLRKRPRLVREEEQQSDPVLAGEFAAGAGAAESRFREVDLGLVRL
jgi:hypothetical protein